MKIEFDAGDGSRHRVQRYAPGVIMVNQTEHRRSLILTPDRVADWPPQAFDELSEAHFTALLAYRPEVVLLGTGAQLRFPHPGDTRALTAAGIGVEVMDTGAACRTYNLLMQDDRRVLAALLMINRPDAAGR